MNPVPAVWVKNTKNVADRKMSEQHFDCTICGKFCYGMMPLNIDKALHYADLFPLAIVWRPLRRDTHGVPGRPPRRQREVTLLRTS